ncbi:MAG: CocE/NonD family hydrolase [Chitinophagales bacterium]
MKKYGFYSLFIATLLIALYHSTSIFAQRTEGIEDKISEFGAYDGYSEERKDKLDYYSYYIPTDDDELLATDVILPRKKEKGEQFPTVLFLTRYLRSLEGKWFIKPLKNPVFGQVSEDEIKFWVSNGYAVVLVDVRGTGASTGIRPMEFSPREIADGDIVADWITEQEWSDGNIGVTGVSYLGTTAELLLVNQHPAVKACIPRSNIFDLYNDITYPGGIPHEAFIEVWKNLTQNLDTNNIGYVSKQAERLIKGVSPVKKDKKRVIFNRAIEDHTQNFDIFKALPEIEFKDEVHYSLEKPISAYTISSYIDKISNSGTAIYRIDGWWDGGLSRSAVYGYLSTPNSKRLTIGPWDHGPHEDVSPFTDDMTVKFDLLSEMLRFFDFYVKGIDNGIDQEAPINYYTFGQEQWKTAEVWPIPEAINDTLYLSSQQQLVEFQKEVEGTKSTYKVDYTVGTGDAAGWNSMTDLYRFGGPINYPDRAAVNEKMEVYTTKPFSQPTEITGHVIVDLYMSVPTKDGAVFAYLEEVSPEGFVQYITEGELRLIHRKISDEKTLPTVGPFHSFLMKDAEEMVPNEVARVAFEMIPTSYEVPAGHSIRLSIAGCDIDHFSLTEIQPETMTFYFSEEYPSQLILPIVNSSNTDKN